MITVQSTAAGSVATYAARELASLLASVSAEIIQGESKAGANRRINLTVTPGLRHAVTIHHTAHATRIAGRTETDLLHGVYRFLEKAGFLFTVRGPVPPAMPLRLPAPFNLEETPVIPDRGIRQHINFPMDISGYALPDAREYIRNLARMKFSAITFHLYDSMGWFHFNAGYSVGDPSLHTLYYSTPFPVCKEPAARSRSSNLEQFFIPEIESRRGTGEQNAALNAWLGRLLHTARECGLRITISIEVYAPFIDAELRKIGITPDPDACIRTSAAAARAILEQYPEIDELELISREFEGSWPSPETTAEVWRTLTAEYGLPETAGKGYPQPKPEDERALARELWNSARALKMAVDTRARLLADPKTRGLVGKRTISCGLYMITRNVWNYLPAVIEKIVPPDIRFTALATYGARWVAEYLDASNFSAPFLKRMRIYTWCEFDGLMFLQQNHCKGLADCLAVARRYGDDKKAAGLMANHWRNAENEISISYLAAATWSGVTPEVFYRNHLARLCGTPQTGELAYALELIDDATDFATRNLFNCGFCPPFVWSRPDRIDNVSRYTQANVSEYRLRLEQAVIRLRAALPRIRRAEGLARCRLLINRLEASQMHCEVLSNLIRMRAILLRQTDVCALAAASRRSFAKLHRATRLLVARYTACTAAMMPDRGAEGTLTAYEQCLYGCLDKLAVKYLDEKNIEMNTEGGIVPIPVMG